ncbi:uncharacterized protein LOC124917527 [Impatiens glandulifera]|uniref:uncharacterized protein LOC124917527 n=1 Tax=Impatiens glandulifera TaxID=253017 RepID=UPI001FB110B3|nr:uncharacterized protein LOC124917527 [Impatiens glandulifera]
MRKLTERYIPGAPKSQLQLLVLELLAVKKGEFIDEVARLEAVREQQNTTHSPTLEDVDGHNPGDKSPPADRTIDITDDRTEPPLTDNLESDQDRDSEPAITEGKVTTIINEFANTMVRPWKKKIKKVVIQTIKLAETTRDDLVKANERITSVETNYGEADVRYGDHLKRTIALEEMTPKLADDLKSVNQRVVELERSQEKTEKQLTKVDEDLGRSSAQNGSTLDRVESLEKKNASLEERNDKLEADLKAVTEQVNELINAKIAADKAVEEANAHAAKKLQDALDEQNRTQKEAPRSNAKFNERLRILTTKNPELAKSIAAREAKEAKRFNLRNKCSTNMQKLTRRPRRLPPLRLRQHENGKFLRRRLKSPRCWKELPRQLLTLHQTRPCKPRMTSKRISSRNPQDSESSMQFQSERSVNRSLLTRTPQDLEVPLQGRLNRLRDNQQMT